MVTKMAIVADISHTICERHHIVPVSKKRKQTRCGRPLLMGYVDKTANIGNSIFQFVRDFAINKLKTDVISQLDVITNSCKCDSTHGKVLTIDAIPHGLYNWSWDLFEQRRNMRGASIWLSVLEKQIPEKCLEILKFQLDLKHLKSYLEPLLESFLDSSDFKKNKEIIAEHVLAPIVEASNFLDIYEWLSKQLKLASEVTKELYSISELCDPTQRIKRDIAIDDHNEMIDFDVQIPIETRCGIRYYQNIVSQWQNRILLDEAQFVNEVEKYLKYTKTDKNCSENATKHYNVLIEKYKYQISCFNNLFNRALEDVENKINYKNIKINKMKDQRRALLMEIDRFHAAIDQVLREEQELREAEERRLQEELEARLAEEAEAARLAAKAAKKAAKAAKAAAKKK